ncbi:MAG: polyphosphate polymerase domain-containing protein [Myxococcales bacterium]|nr:polyphosphate polymerase domain-containing protein [Myxococcales bacterium]
MRNDSMVISRYENKYLIRETMARAIADYLRGICVPDKHAGADGRYMVNNLYFDTPDLRFYHDTRNKRYTRFKPRVRYYGPRPTDFLWIELKHKVKNVTWKKRRRIAVADWPEFLHDGSCRPPANPAWITLADSFEDAVCRFGAHPVVQVQYIREPYVSELDDYCRITFDRCLTFRSVRGSYELVANENLTYFDNTVDTAFCSCESPVILEIKTETNVPIWVLRLIRRFELIQRGFSKYCNAIEAAMGYTACSLRRLA